MGILHRVLSRHRADVWHTQTRLMHAVGVVRPPVAVQWLVTAACDLACPHCYSAAGRRARDELTTEQARALVDALVDLGRPLLVLAGGELLLRRDIPDIVAYASARGLSWAMHTHGLHVPRFAALLAAHPPELAAISLDGDRSFHDAFRGRAGSFDAALHAAAVLRETGCREVVLGTTITRDNADRVADLFPIVAGSRATSWGLHLFAPEGRGHTHAELFPTPGQLRRVAAFARRRRAVFPIELCNEWGSAGADDLYYRDQPFSCGAGSLSFVVSATGDVLPCTTTDPAEAEGNVRTTPLAEIWRRGFSRFRGGACGERGECWLQTRNGVRCAEDAFGAAARTPAPWVERVPQAIVRRIAPRRARIVSPRTTAALEVLAAGLVVLQGCTRPAEPSTPREPAQSTDTASGPGPWTAAAIGVPGGFPTVLASNITAHFLQSMSGSAWWDLRSGFLACEAAPAECGGARGLVDHWIGDVAHEESVARARRAGSIREHLDAMAEGRPTSTDDAIGVLDAVELTPVYDRWLAGHLWRRVREAPVADPGASLARVRAFARLHQHLRVADALARAAASVGDVQVRPWLKKSMAPADHEEIVLPPGLADAAEAAYPSATAGTWDDLALPLSVAEGAVVVAHAGGVRRIAAGGSLSLTRLHVLACPHGARLETADGRRIAIPVGGEATLHDLPARLSTDDRAAIEASVDAARRGEPGALDRVQADLLLSHAAIREALREHPEAPGAPGLHTLLVSYDE